MLKLVVVSAFAVAAVLQGVIVPEVSATKSDKVTICHATNAHKNPYTVNHVNTSSVDEKNNKNHNGHGDHEGVVWTEDVADHSWGDIIPPFESPKGLNYPGLNWNEEGKAIYNNGCKVGTKVSVPAPVVEDENEPGKGAVTPHETPVVEDEEVVVDPEVEETPVVEAPVAGKGSVAPAVEVTELPETGASASLAVLMAVLLAAGTYGATYAAQKRLSL